MEMWSGVNNFVEETEYTKLPMFYITKEYLLESQMKCSTSTEGEGPPRGQAELNLGDLAGFDWLGWGVQTSQYWLGRGPGAG